MNRYIYNSNMGHQRQPGSGVSLCSQATRAKEPQCSTNFSASGMKSERAGAVRVKSPHGFSWTLQVYLPSGYLT